ncbi:hypothetical protein AB0E63_06880 [Kribbella sp. NPDC026596]|uniref:hypothetical protein n=1 Tax=Kribbella sp. NPDC026596 TaxID=3155122 RepID=UPI0033FB666F
MSIFRRPTDPTEEVLRRLSKRLRWFRPALADAPTPYLQLGHLAQHRLCPAIEQGDAAPVVTALAIAEEALAGADLDDEPGANLDHALTLNLVEVVSDWCSWPETSPQVVATIEAGMGPMTRGGGTPSGTKASPWPTGSVTEVRPTAPAQRRRRTGRSRTPISDSRASFHRPSRIPHLVDDAVHR